MLVYCQYDKYLSNNKNIILKVGYINDVYHTYGVYCLQIMGLHSVVVMIYILILLIRVVIVINILILKLTFHKILK